MAISSVQAASSPAGVPFGRLVLAAGYLSGVASATESCQLASSAAFSAQQDLLTVGYAAASVYVVEINGTTEGVNANTDAPTTATDIAAAITANPFFAADGVSASAAGDVVTVTIAAGGEFNLRVFVTNDPIYLALMESLQSEEKLAQSYEMMLASKCAATMLASIGVLVL